MKCSVRKLVVLLSSILVCFAVPCFAADQPTVLVVAQDGAQLFYHQNGRPIDMEEIPKGTELTIESTSGERCFVTYKGKPAYIRRQFLATKQGVPEAQQHENQKSLDSHSKAAPSLESGKPTQEQTTTNVALETNKRLAELRARAETGDAKAQNDLGICYLNGEGVTKNEAEAVKWYRKAAEQNLAMAQYNLGVSYYVGQGVAKDEAKAVRWFRKAAEQNDADAQYNLGLFYAKGQGVTKNEAEAVKWITLAAAQGNQQAKAAVSVIESNSQQKQIAEGKRRANDWLDSWKRVSAASRSQP